MAEAFGLSHCPIALKRQWDFILENYMQKNLDKPFKTFHELVLHLQNEHELKIIDPIWAEHALKIVPYYDLINGYKDVFMTNDKFQSSITFEYLYLFHTFDRQIQNILFSISTLVEDYFKNNLAYILAKDFGAHEIGYLSNKNYISRKGNISYESTYKRICAIYTDRETGKIKPRYLIDEPTAHYVYKHNHIPPWILLKNVTFSNAINLFVLLKPSQKEELTNMLIPTHLPIDQKIQLLQYSLTMVRKFRNKIAHNLKFISFNSKKYSKALNYKSVKRFIPNSLLSWKDIHRNVGIYDIYAYICFSMALLPDCIEKRMIVGNLIGFLKAYADDDSGVHKNVTAHYFQYTHIPDNIIDRLLLYLNEVNNRMKYPSIQEHQF